MSTESKQEVKGSELKEVLVIADKLQNAVWSPIRDAKVTFDPVEGILQVIVPGGHRYEELWNYEFWHAIHLLESAYGATISIKIARK
jgi:hypothetical protein